MQYIKIAGNLWSIVIAPPYSTFAYEVTAQAPLAEIINAVETQHNFKIRGALFVHQAALNVTVRFNRFV